MRGPIPSCFVGWFVVERTAVSAADAPRLYAKPKHNVIKLVFNIFIIILLQCFVPRLDASPTQFVQTTPPVFRSAVFTELAVNLSACPALVHPVIPRGLSQ